MIPPRQPDKRPRARVEAFPVPRGLRAARVKAADGEVLVLSVPVDVANLPPGLTPAEADVAARLVAGETNDDIARARLSSVRTVANQVASIFRKLRVSSRAELTALVCARTR